MLSTCVFIAAAAIWYTKRLWGCWFNPLAIFLVIWSVVAGVYSLNLLPYYELEVRTLMVMLGAALSLCGGCVLSSLFFLRWKTYSTPARIEDRISIVKLRRVVIALYFIGILLLVGYVFEIRDRLGLEQVLLEPWRLRAALPEGEFGWYLRFFYFTMPAAVLAFLHFRLSKEYRLLMIAIIISSIVFGVATTGRMAVIWLMAWLMCIYLFLAERDGKELRALAGVAVTLIIGFVLFVAMGNWVGKTYKNSAFTTTKNVTDSLSFLVVPYYYFTTSVPAFQNLILGDPEWALGKYTFLPLMKLAGPIVDIDVPAEVSEFTSTPYMANTYTFLAPYYRDFGLTGVFVCPAVLGFVVGCAFFYMRLKGMTLHLLLTNSLLATVMVATYGSNILISAPTWWFLAVSPLLDRLCARNSHSNRV